MSLLAPTLQSFFTERLALQRRASPHTVASYRDAFRLLLGFANAQRGIPPSKLRIEDLDAPFVGAFLDHLERERHNSIRTRNNRLAAIHSLFRYAALRHPEHAASIQRVLAMPSKRADRELVSFLTAEEVDALVSAPDTRTWIGRRDRTLLILAAQTGMRVSELTGLTCGDVWLGAGRHVRCYGKGRKNRTTPLAAGTAALLEVWLAERRGHASAPLFPTRRGGPLSRDAVELLVARHVETATKTCPSLAAKTVTPHVLRHTCAMNLLAIGTDVSVIALYLGHETIASTTPYLHADLSIKERALARTKPIDTAPGRYRAPDPLLAFLEAL